MSALGHLQTRPRRRWRSALPRKRTFPSPAPKSALGQKQTHALQQAGLFDHLVGSQQYGGGQASFECRRLGFWGTSRCSWDNSPRPAAGEKLSLLPAKR